MSSPFPALFRKNTVIQTAAALLSVFILTFFPAAPLQAAEQALILYAYELRPAVDGLHIDLDCSVADEDILRDLLKDGASIELALFFELEKKRSWWSNANILNKTIRQQLRHDPLTREFVLSDNQQSSVNGLRDKNLTRLLYKSWRNLHFLLFSQEELQQLSPDFTYLLHIQLDLYHIEVPPWLEKSTLFWSPELAPTLSIELPLDHDFLTGTIKPRGK